MDEFISSIRTIMERDLGKLKQEITLYPSQTSIWKIEKEIKNSAGNLCLHICGNLQHFVGTVLGHSGYIRNREYEFSASNVSRNDLFQEIQQTQVAVQQALSKLDSQTLNQEYPLQTLGFPMSTTFFLIHLTAHLEYHLGQINYHRRLVAV